jgi:phosphatidylglycerol:prolipoprotein diacylglycerol transferase
MSIVSSILMLIAIGCSLAFWRSRRGDSPEMVLVVLGALCGAAFGSKLGYCFSEVHVLLHNPRWMEMVLVGKTVVGGLLGGYIGVELAKKLVRYQGVTGDLFAQMVPLSIALGRIGCMVNRCCPGQELPPAWYTVTHADGSVHWPAAEVELIFNLVAAAVFMILRRRGILPGQHFHLYMISYGTFRFFHEWMRHETLLVAPWTGYQLLSLLLALSGLVLFVRRQRLGVLGLGRHDPPLTASSATK